MLPPIVTFAVALPPGSTTPLPENAVICTVKVWPNEVGTNVRKAISTHNPRIPGCAAHICKVDDDDSDLNMRSRFRFN
jgi:hypothetical protein